MAVLAVVLLANDAPKPTAASNGAAVKPEAKEKRGLTETEKRGYALGAQLGSDIVNQGLEVNPHRVVQGLMDALTSSKLIMTVQEINTIITAVKKEQRQKIRLATKELTERNKKEGEAFLATNKAKKGIVSLPDGLQYKILRAGDGKKPTVEDSVVIKYWGTRIDGTEIDKSSKRDEAFTFPLRGVIKGWSEALQLMPVGSKWQLFIPPHLAYGEQGVRGTIGPNATLIFELELVSIQDSSRSGVDSRPARAGLEPKPRP